MWKNIDNWNDLRAVIHETARQIRTNHINLGRQTYSLSLLHGVFQAILCENNTILAVELGVASGNGLKELSAAADFFSNRSGISIEVYGFDNVIGLPNLQGPEDHPEIWQQGQFAMGDSEKLINELPGNTKLIIGDVGETITKFLHNIEGKQIAFVAIDLDFYSSTSRAMNIFEFPADNYIPAVPVYVDDAYDLITYNPWCGEEKAINEFNLDNQYRKIHRKPNFDIDRFHICQILDHPIRNGVFKPKFPFEIGLGII